MERKRASEIILVLAIMVLTVVVAGCSQTPSAVEQETPGVLNNATDLFTVPPPTVTTEIVQPTFAQLVTGSDYVAPPTQTPVAAQTTSQQDPLIGDWVLTGNPTYSCNANIDPDNTGTISCEANLVQKQIYWNPSPVPSQYSWMNNYSIQDITDGENYSAMYSYNDDTITSDILPAGTEFQRG